MATRPDVTPNRRGLRSRETVLDAAERVMAQHGFEAATVARIVEESGVPMSSVYHYFGSKNGVLLAVMERGAARFFTALPQPRERTGASARTHLETLAVILAATLDEHPDFLRLLLVLALQPTIEDAADVQAVVDRVRATALQGLRQQIALAFDLDQSDPDVDAMARFALASLDGGFIASRADAGVTLAAIVQQLPAALIGIKRRNAQH